MDIELLSRMVAELVLDHDRIGLPGMGSFVAEVVPASFADRGYSINPPYRRLSFHAGYPSDDLLASYYAESNSIELAEAKAILADYISQMKEVLKNRKTIIFPGLGRLRATKDNTFFFVQNEDLDIFPEGITLAPVSLKTHIESPEEVAKAVSSLSAMIAAQPVVSQPVGANSAVAQPVESPLADPQLAAVLPADPQPAAEPDKLALAPTPKPEATPAPAPAPAQSAPESAPISEPELPQPVYEQVADSEPQPAQTAPESAPAQPEQTPEIIMAGPAAAGPEPAPIAEPTPSVAVEPEPEVAVQTPDVAESPVVAQPESDSAPAAAEPSPAPVTTEPAPAPKPAAAPKAKQSTDINAESLPRTVTELGSRKKRRSRWWIPVLVVLGIAALALGVFVLLAHAAPDLIDSILYTPEELRIINY